jgi:D-tyrosyl-tRNA(Tyr) deacylase
MKAVIQRVKKANVTVGDAVKGEIGIGLLIFLGVAEDDNLTDVEWLANKISQIRIFSDNKNNMNESIKQINGEILVISQFTLHAKTKKGNRPSFIEAANSDLALDLYTRFINLLGQLLEINIQSGEFGSKMNVMLENDGPVTIIIDTKNKQ